MRIKGWKRRTRALSLFIQSQINLDMDRLLRYKCDYVKLYLDPFYRLNKPPPPNWFFRRYLRGLGEIHNKWEIQLKKAELDYYLKIWIFETQLAQSQIVVGIEDRADRYKNIFQQADQSLINRFNKFGCREIFPGFSFNVVYDQDCIDADDYALLNKKEREAVDRNRIRTEFDQEQELIIFNKGLALLCHKTN